MTVPSMSVHGVCVQMFFSSQRIKAFGKGVTLFNLDVFIPSEINAELVRMPTVETMDRLACKFLNCEYHEPYRRESMNLQFLIKTGIPAENRAAFLGAVCSRMKIPLPRY